MTTSIECSLLLQKLSEKFYEPRKKFWNFDWLKISRFQFHEYKIEKGIPDGTYMFRLKIYLYNWIIVVPNYTLNRSICLTKL